MTVACEDLDPTGACPACAQTDTVRWQNRDDTRVYCSECGWEGWDDALGSDMPEPDPAPSRFRPTPPAPGFRPPSGVRFVSGRCAADGCGEAYTLDLGEQPWARSRTCSPACARRVGHRHRRPDNRHRALVEGYRLQRDTDVRAREVMAADEDLVPVTFREWLSSYQWERAA